MWRWILLAIALLIIWRIKPKLFFVIAGASLVLFSGIGLWTCHDAKSRSQVDIRVSYDRSACPAERPLSVTIANASDKTLERVLFSLNAVLPGYSSTITPYTYKQYRSDKILEPGESHAACYSEPLLSPAAERNLSPSELDWSARVDSAYYR